MFEDNQDEETLHLLPTHNSSANSASRKRSTFSTVVLIALSAFVSLALLGVVIVTSGNNVGTDLVELGDKKPIIPLPHDPHPHKPHVNQKNVTATSSPTKLPTFKPTGPTHLPTPKPTLIQLDISKIDIIPHDTHPTAPPTPVPTLVPTYHIDCHPNKQPCLNSTFFGLLCTVREPCPTHQPSAAPSHYPLAVPVQFPTMPPTLEPTPAPEDEADDDKSTPDEKPAPFAIPTEKKE